MEMASMVPLVESQPARRLQTGAAKIEVRLQSIRYLAENIKAFEFVSPDGALLPAFSAGSHIDVHLPNRAIRQYSLCNSPAQRHRYEVAVLRDPHGRGGSIAMHDALRVGQLLTISAPRNQFALAPDASLHLFIAGGIGITPIMSMIAQAERLNQPFHLHYCARSPERTAFLPELAPLIESGRATIHYDGGEPSKGLDLNLTLTSCLPGTHLYHCGPPGFFQAASAASAHWPRETCHSEQFSPAESPALAVAAASANLEQPFEVELKRSQKRFTVAPGKSIVDVLADHGVEVDTSCRKGTCGTCMTRFLEGEPLHRDSVLDEEDREEFIMICCSRSRGPKLVLDL